ncbi:fructose-bisphosphatase class II family protein [Amycolatopsis alkalitolerans]|uniref:Fructose-1,6-bisphosphatase n=1 Tax=Amycolatopsis alkalitolerans TaxID=2547244 RepID=A0A5C4LPF2_9PSEU|nr:fructose-bisphosphatase class II family protein [Amycolatopsis alkalitolerans]TNC18948.1 fructose-bisphosphatase class II family protein [Amycolatopsis alkalitolerans]
MKTQESGIPVPTSGSPDHTLALELVRVTEAAAIAAARWVGRGDEGRGKVAAVDAMHGTLRSVSMRGMVVVGEDPRRDPAVLCHGADIGDGDGPACDIAISVGDGALSPARDVPSALAAVAVAESGAMFEPPARVMEKLAVGPDYVGFVDLDRPVAENLRAVAKVKDGRTADVVVAVLNRPRHRELVREIRDAGARVHLIEGGDVAGAIAAARPDSPVDMLLGTGDAAEGVIAAAGLACLGGAFQARLRSETGRDSREILHADDLVRGESVLFCATGVTDSELLRGVLYHEGRTTTHSMVLCAKPETVRIVKSAHPARG